MPIYAYRCSACGHAKDVLQKLSDAPLTTCPVCSAQSFSKQVTAAGFQLKGSGWYATDFRGGNSTAAAPASGGAEAAGAAPAAGDASGGTTAAASPAASSSPPCGGSCACH